MTQFQIIQLIRQAKHVIGLLPGYGEMRAARIPSPAAAHVERAYTEVKMALSIIDAAIPDKDMLP